VTSLASTSSGHLAEVPHGSDTLSGSITLQTGSGAAQTITLDSSNNTLSDLAAAINSSGVGITASVLTDSSGSRLSLVSGTSGEDGSILVSANTIKDGKTHLAYTPAVTGSNASLTVDGVSLSTASNTVTNLIPGVTFQLLAPSTKPVQVVIGNDNSVVEKTMAVFVSDYNALVTAINAQEGTDSDGDAQPLFGSPTLTLLQQQLLNGLNTVNPNGSFTSITAGTGTTLAGSMTIAVGNGEAQTITLDPSANSISDLADAINSADIGVTAAVVTKNNISTLTLRSGTEGGVGRLTVNSGIVATSYPVLGYFGKDGTDDVPSTGTLTAIAGDSDELSGSIAIQVGNGTTKTITIDPSNNTLAKLASAINAADMGVTASVVTSDGSSSLSLLSETPGKEGTLNVASSILNVSDPSTANLSYANASDITNLTAMGISVNNNGSISLDAAKLDSVLNADYSGVEGFFQSANGWGTTFSTMLAGSGNSSTTGILSLAAKSNSTIESTLNKDITREEALISTEKTSLTSELNKANEVLQEIPMRMKSVDELYSAVTGYKGS